MGVPVPGCADAGDPSLTDNEKLLLGLPADSWYTAPNTQLYDVCKSVSTYGDGVYLVQGCPAIVSAWSSGAYDSQRQRIWIFGGGHNDYGGNELYYFDLKTFTWIQATQPSQPPFNKDPLDDGRPVSRHTYDGVEFIPHRGTLFVWGGSRATDGNGTDLTWEFRPDTNEWVNLAPTPPQYSSPYDFGLAYDPVTKKVFLHAHAVFSAYDFDTNTWTRLEDFGYPPFTGKYDPWVTRTGAIRGRYFVSTGAGSATLFWNIDTSAVDSLSAPWSTLGGNTTAISRGGPGLDFDLAAQQLVAWSGGAPAALDETAYEWVERSATGAPATQTGTGTYGRWRYIERYNVFILVNSTTEDVAFYKHTAGCGGP